jgi:transcriptional regulator with XRE-family HTH domain
MRITHATHSLRPLRLERGLTLADLAALTGLSQGMLSMLETDKRQASLGSVELIANALGVPADSLLQIPDGGQEELCEVATH